MSNTLDNLQANSWQSSFILTSNVWSTVDSLNKCYYSGSQNMQSETIVNDWHKTVTLLINKTPFIQSSNANYNLAITSFGLSNH